MKLNQPQSSSGEIITIHYSSINNVVKKKTHGNDVGIHKTHKTQIRLPQHTILVLIDKTFLNLLTN